MLLEGRRAVERGENTGGMSGSLVALCVDSSVVSAADTGSIKTTIF